MIHFLGMKQWTREEKAAALRALVLKYAGTLTDQQISGKCGAGIERVKKCRQRLGIRKTGYHHKESVS